MERPDADEITHARLFWSGGSQAVRFPKSMRLPGAEVRVRREGRALVIEPLEEAEGLDAFWERLVPLQSPVRRWPTKKAERRRSL
jgi:virulence-associated protein VagC